MLTEREKELIEYALRNCPTADVSDSAPDYPEDELEGLADKIAALPEPREFFDTVLRHTAIAKGRTDWMQAVLASGDAYSAMMDLVIDCTEAGGPERHAAVSHASEWLKAQHAPSHDLVYAVAAMMETDLRVRLDSDRT